MDYKIEDNIPIPKMAGRGAVQGELVKTLRNLAVGQSVFVANKKSAYTSSMVQPVQKKYGSRFVTRTVEGGARIWRIE